MLFDDNFPQAFTAEDIAVVGGVVIDRLGDLVTGPK
jgi:Mg2+/Co2+ transporter CorC